MKRYKVGILGATGTVGLKFIELLSSHPWFEITLLASSERTAGKTLLNALPQFNPLSPFSKFVLFDVKKDMQKIAQSVDFVFCAIGGEKEEVAQIEEGYAKLDIPVVSNNSALRDRPDVPMVIPELNPSHLSVLPFQQKRLGVKRGFCVVKSNCSLQSYLPLLFPLRKFGLKQVIVTSCQAVSGAGKTLDSFPQVHENLLPYIVGEEEKSESEPLKILGRVKNGKIIPSKTPIISSHCLRVPVADGHTATVSVSFETPPTKTEIISAWKTFTPLTQKLSLPSAPSPFITYFDNPFRPQPRLDCLTQNGMSICVGRLREDKALHYKFTGLSHNTIRGAAGGAILLAELLAVKGYL